jgi:hypothetical protein
MFLFTCLFKGFKDLLVDKPRLTCKHDVKVVDKVLVLACSILSPFTGFKVCDPTVGTSNFKNKNNSCCIHTGMISTA